MSRRRRIELIDPSRGPAGSATAAGRPLPALAVAPQPALCEGLAAHWDASPRDIPGQTTPPARRRPAHHGPRGERCQTSEDSSAVLFLTPARRGARCGLGDRPAATRGDGWVMKTIGLAMALERTGTTTGCPRKPEDEEDRLVANRTGRLPLSVSRASRPSGGWLAQNQDARLRSERPRFRVVSDPLSGSAGHCWPPLLESQENFWTPQKLFPTFLAPYLNI